MKKRTWFAPFLMLLAGAVTSITMFVGDYDTTELLVVLLCVMLFFYGIGTVIQRIINSYVDQILEKERIEAENEEEVIEKEISGSERNSTEA